MYSVSVFKSDEDGFIYGRLFSPFGGEIVKDEEMEIQNFLIYLLTEKGSIPYRKDYGSPFLKMLKNQSHVSEIDIFQIFNLSVSEFLNSWINLRNTIKIDNITLNKLNIIDSGAILEIVFKFKNNEKFNKKLILSMKI